MAELIATVDAPLASEPGHPPLLLGAYVEARIVTRALDGAVEIDRAWLRDGGTVWVMDPDDRLEVRSVDVAWAGRSKALVVGGLAPGERIVTTRLAMHADGMALRTPENTADQTAEAAQ